MAESDELFLDAESLAAARQELNDGAKTPRSRAFVYACERSEIPANGRRGKVVRFDKDEVALFAIENTVYAISSICPHQLSPLLSEGLVDKDSLTIACPLHGWTYRLADGKSVVGDSSIPCYAVKIVENEIWVEEPLNDPTVFPLE